MYLNTARLPWYSLREAVAADDTALSGLTGGFIRSNFPAVGTTPEIGQNGAIDLAGPLMQDANGVYIAAWGAGGDGKTITAYRIYGITRSNGPIILLLEGVMTSGSLACANHPLTNAALTSNYWVDTITVTGGLLKAVTDILDSGNNTMCMLRFDTTIFDQIYLEYDEYASGMTAFNAMICGY